MSYEPFDFSLINFNILHDNCWTRLTESLPVQIRTVLARPQRSKGEILGLIEVKVRKESAFKSFIRRLSLEPTIDRIISAGSIVNSRHLYKILFKEKYDNMLRGVLENYGVVYENDYMKDGLENLSLVIPTDEVGELKKELSRIGRVNSFSSHSVDEDDYLNYGFALSDRELMVLRTAHTSGFYDFPKRTYLAGISTLTNLSKSTVEEHLRKAESKIISKEMYRISKR